MKKLFLNFTMVLVATSLMLVSCNTKTDGVDDPANDSIPAGVQEDLATILKEQGYTLANAAFGTAYPSYSYIDVYFANEADTVAISFTTEEGKETLPVGEYSMDEYVENEDGEMELEYLPGTWDPEYSYWWNAKTAEATEYGVYFFSEGTVSVEKSGRNYAVKIDLVDENGDAIKWAYVGQIELTLDDGYSNPYYGEEETEDQSLSLSEISATYYGDNSVGFPYYYIYLTNNDGTAEVVLYAFGNTSSTATELTSGEYNVVAVTNIGEFTLLEGSFDGETAEEKGHFVYGMKGSIALLNDGQYYTGIYYFTGGSLTVNKEGENYTIAGTLTSALGTNVEISYTGAISIEDATSSDAATSSVKSVKPVKQGKKLGRRVVRK